MEAEHRSNTLINLLATTKLVLYTVLEFLTPQDLWELYLSVKESKHESLLTLQAILEAYLYIRQHMTSTDRSYYFGVYDHPKFRAI